MNLTTLLCSSSIPKVEGPLMIWGLAGDFTYFCCDSWLISWTAYFCRELFLLLMFITLLILMLVIMSPSPVSPVYCWGGGCFEVFEEFVCLSNICCSIRRVWDWLEEKTFDLCYLGLEEVIGWPFVDSRFTGPLNVKVSGLNNPVKFFFSVAAAVW